MAGVGARLRDERERLGLNQGEFGALGGVTRQSQAEYEAGKRGWNLGYMLATAEAGVDPLFVLTGERAADTIDQHEGELLAGFARLASAHRDAVSTIVGGLSGQPTRSVNAPAQAYAARPTDLPSEPALARALEGVLAVYPDLRGVELAQALARHLPSVIGAAADALPAQAAPAQERPGNRLPNRREPRPARRT